ncbi:MAG: ABC transporter ATP-binding protein [Clostridia bacterium]|jgi:NitT/TauT family transport system ATP-binding protein
MSSLIEVKNVIKQYSNAEGKLLTVLDGIDLNFEQGSFTCILGPSGCGKTTLLELIGGFQLPTSGQILTNGNPVKGPGMDRSMVFQTFDQLLPWKTVFKNVEYALTINKIGADKKEREDTVMKFLSLVELEKFRDYYPHQISGGMKQRVAIARSLAQRPQVILMDEPFASLDSQTRNTLQEQLFRIWEKANVTIVFITHNIQEAIVLGSKIVVMAKSPSKIVVNIDNPVDAGGGIRFPDAKGYNECWKFLHEKISAQTYKEELIQENNPDEIC